MNLQPSKCLQNAFMKADLQPSPGHICYGRLVKVVEEKEKLAGCYTIDLGATAAQCSTFYRVALDGRVWCLSGEGRSSFRQVTYKFRTMFFRMARSISRAILGTTFQTWNRVNTDPTCRTFPDSRISED